MKMSKWVLLKDVIAKGHRNTTSTNSIHKFEGHQLFATKRFLWTGYQFQVSFAEDDDVCTILALCESYIHASDSSEIFLTIFGIPLKSIDNLLDILVDNHSSICFDLLKKDCDSDNYSIKFRVSHATFVPLHSCLEYRCYNLEPFSENCLYTREPAKTKRIKAQDLLSNRLYGVDNTGNVCVWPAESILLYYLLANRNLVGGKKVVELGGGSSGLVGLGLSSTGLCDEVLITDGHPHCIINQNACLTMCKSQGSIAQDAKISIVQLEWSCNDNETIERMKKKWDVVCGADCLFFKDFHDALINTIDELLTENGIGVFLQPQRSGTMDLFIEKAASHFHCEVKENYLPELTTQKELYLSTCADYNVDVHYPILLILSRKS